MGNLAAPNVEKLIALIRIINGDVWKSLMEVVIGNRDLERISLQELGIPACQGGENLRVTKTFYKLNYSK